jgi:hypothetical protein
MWIKKGVGGRKNGEATLQNRGLEPRPDKSNGTNVITLRTGQIWHKLIKFCQKIPHGIL